MEEAEDISSKPAAAITMDVAAEAMADAAAAAVEAEHSRARTPTTKLNLESSRSTAGRTDATAAIMVSNANSRPWATFHTQPRAIPCRGTPRMRIESIYRAQSASLITGDGWKRSKRKASANSSNMVAMPRDSARPEHSTTTVAATTVAMVTEMAILETSRVSVTTFDSQGRINGIAK